MISRFILIGLLGVAVLPACAAEKPLWEVGAGIGALLFDDYRGADESRLYPVPVPYVVYRGRFLKADREGVRGLLFDRRYAELNFSVNATIPVQSEDNAARRGMPDLESTLELGPSLEVHLWKSGNEDWQLDLRMPLRVPVTIESSPQAIGWIFSPRLNLDIRNVGGHTGWDLGVSIGPMFADRKYHRYFYSVAAQFATPERPEYQARGGYSGAHALMSLSKRFPGYWIGAYLRYDTLESAQFVASPLVKRDHSIAAGFGIAWMIGESSRLVETDE